MKERPAQSSRAFGFPNQLTSEIEAEAEPEVSLVKQARELLRLRNLIESAQICRLRIVVGNIQIPQDRVPEMWRVAEIECFRADLDLQPLGDRKVAERDCRTVA